jgi:hypothetical protein
MLWICFNRDSGFVCIYGDPEGLRTLVSMHRTLLVPKLVRQEEMAGMVSFVVILPLMVPRLCTAWLPEFREFGCACPVMCVYARACGRPTYITIYIIK